MVNIEHLSYSNPVLDTKSLEVNLRNTSNGVIVEWNKFVSAICQDSIRNTLLLDTIELHYKRGQTILYVSLRMEQIHAFAEHCRGLTTLNTKICTTKSMTNVANNDVAVHLSTLLNTSEDSEGYDHTLDSKKIVLTTFHTVSKTKFKPFDVVLFSIPSTNISEMLDYNPWMKTSKLIVVSDTNNVLCAQRNKMEFILQQQ